MKKPKKKKLESIPKINRRLFKLWSEKIRERHNQRCEYCNISKGEKGHNGKIVENMNAHHIISRVKKDSYLKWDLINGICCCSGCHKFSEDSFHRSPITTMNWLLQNHPDRYSYLLEHFNDKIDLQNREILYEIERCLNEDKPIDILRLKEIEAKYPRQPKKSKKPKGTLFDKESESSSSSQ